MEKPPQNVDKDAELDVRAPDPPNQQPYPPEDVDELEELFRLVQNLVESNPDIPGIGDWHPGFYEGRPFHKEPAFVARDPDRDYTTHNIDETGGGRTYRVQALIDNRFGTPKTTRIVSSTRSALKAIAVGQTTPFVNTARRYGLTWRRNRTLPFPHPLPYASPPPNTPSGRYAEEAAVIAAAFHFPLSASTRIKLTVDYFSEGSTNGYWTLGWATVNLYNRLRAFRINLNSAAFGSFTNSVWSGTIVHEIMHNLGWGHPVGGYDSSKAIVNYDRCVRRATA